ncbi:MAG TPA: hypothetical protein PLN52_24745, partial [Opitutaceae bacterium]|nr:hypothetical protein [Opitutaceae bacterium]
MTEHSVIGETGSLWNLNDIRGTPYRSMADPTNNSAGIDWFPNYNSGNGTHSNSGIAGLVFQLACKGGTHP